MRKELFILETDKQYARTRIAELENEIIALGPEFHKAFTQTSESWHDNAPFEFVRDKQTLLSTEMQNLKHILKDSLPSIPKQKDGVVGIGSAVKLTDITSHDSVQYFIAGDWTWRAGHLVDSHTIISRQSPLASKMIGKKVGDEITHNKTFVINTIEPKDL
jgi:transcription elongation GreA/GreB family factor